MTTFGPEADALDAVPEDPEELVALEVVRLEVVVVWVIPVVVEEVLTPEG